MTKNECFGIPFDDDRPEDIVRYALELIGQEKGSFVVTPNPEIILAAERNPALHVALLGANLILPDGVGLIWASKILGKPLRHRFPGIDFASALMEKLAERQGSVYLLGARPGVAQSAADNLLRHYPGLCVVGIHHGYYPREEEASLLTDIRQSQPDLLLVCLGSPRQEIWMSSHSSDFPGTLMIGLGGALDVYAGRIRRAPALWRRLGLEWLFRLLQEPYRIMRMIRLPGILWAAIKEKAGRKHE